MKKILLIILFFITGCASYTELNKLAIIKSIGISYHDEIYSLYAEIIQEVIDNEPQTKILKVEDKDINNLFVKLNKITNKEISFSHIDLFIIDYTIQNKNYNELITYFINNHGFRNDYYCLLSDDIYNLLTKTKYNEIENLIDTNKRITKLSFLELAKKYLYEESFIISKVSIKEDLIYEANFFYHQNNYERIKYETIKNEN